MKITDKFSAILGFITLISALYLLFSGDTLVGISSSVLGIWFILRGFGIATGKDNSNQQKPD